MAARSLVFSLALRRGQKRWPRHRGPCIRSRAAERQIPLSGTIEAVPAVILLSGAACSGKTTLGQGLRRRMGVEVVATRAVLVELAGERAEELGRSGLQRLGEDLDERTGGGWVAKSIEHRDAHVPTVVDAVRTVNQIALIRAAAVTFHIHLTASATILEKRYLQRVRRESAFEFPTFAALREDSTEASIERLASLADVVIDTGLYDEQATLKCALASLGD